MSVGYPVTAQALNGRLGQVAVQMRNAMEAASDLFKMTNNLGTGGLETAGLSSQDAASYQTMTSYLNTLVGCYYGTVQQGGSGGTGAVEFDFDNALSSLWGGQ